MRKAADFGELNLLVLLNFELDDLLVSLQAFKIDIVSLEDGGLLLFSVGKLIDNPQMPVLLDRERFDGLFDFNSVGLDQPFALEFRLIDPGGRVGFNDRNLLPRGDLKFLDLAVVLDAPRFDFHPRDDALSVKVLRGLDGALLVVLLSIDFKEPDLGLAVDPLGVDQLVFGYADALRLLLGSDLGVADADRRTGTLVLDSGELCGAPRFDVARLIDACVFEIPVDLDGALLGLVILELDLQTGVVFDAISQLPAFLDFLGQLRQPFGIEGIVRVEHPDVGLVEAGQRGVLEFEPMRGQRRRHEIGNLSRELLPPDMHFVHRHGGSDRRHRVDEAALHHFLHQVGGGGALAQRAGGERDILPGGNHAH